MADECVWVYIAIFVIATLSPLRVAQIIRIVAADESHHLTELQVAPTGIANGEVRGVSRYVAPMNFPISVTAHVASADITL